jgi:hypothetical protein
MAMSLYVFLTVCVLGLDFLIYVLFQWMYADKRRAMQKKLAEFRETEKVKPFVMPARKAGAVTQARLQKVRARMSMQVRRSA